MNRLIHVGRIFFAIALIGLGTEHLIFEEFITGRAPAWPGSIPGGVVWAYLTGVAVVATGGTVLTGKHARPAAIAVAVLIGCWALLRHVPVLAADSFLSGAWTRAGKALTLAGGALAVAATFPKVEAARNTVLVRLLNPRRAFIVVGRLCLGLFLVITGVQHFLVTEFVAALIPGWFPGDAVFWTYFAGVALIAGGIGLVVPQTARLAALLSGLMVFSWFWIVHIPRSFVGVSDSIAVFEALAVSGIAFVLAGHLSEGTTEIT
jgi:uncharacterized membrane protein